MSISRTARRIHDKLVLPPRLPVELPVPMRPTARACTWRDATGPGYAVGITERLAEYVDKKAREPYRCV